VYRYSRSFAHRARPARVLNQILDALLDTILVNLIW
jgi:hypothetical protein